MNSHVVIVGGGFAGLAAAKTFAKQKQIRVTLVDRRNHHLFQPLLYQVAMAGLSPADIAAPIRGPDSRPCYTAQERSRNLQRSEVGRPGSEDRHDGRRPDEL